MRRAIILIAVCICWWQIPSQAGEADELGFARKLYQDRMYGLAAEQLAVLLRDRPEDSEAAAARLLLSHCHLKAEKFEQALQSYQDFIVAHPDNIHLPEAWKGYAQSLAFLGKRGKAADSYLRLQRLFPGSHLAPESLLEAGKIFCEAGQPTQALEPLKQLISEYNTSPLVDEAHYWLGVAHWESGNHTDALAGFAKVTSGEWRAKALLQTTAIGLEQDNLLEAQTAFSQLQKSFPKDISTAEAAILLAGRLRERGRSSEAAEFLRQAVGILPEGELREKTALELADSYLAAGQNSLALALCRDFLNEHPQSHFLPEAMFSLEKAYLNQNDLKSALDTFHRLQTLASKSEYVKLSYRLLGQAYLKNGQATEAAGFYSEYLSLCSEKQEAERAKFELARIYQKELHWLTKAALLYQELTQGTAALAESSQFALAQCLEQQGEPDQAQEAYQLLLQRFPTGELAPEARQRLEYIQEFSPNWKRATESLVHTLKDALSDTSDERSLFGLALTCYRDLKDFPRAASIFETYVERHPQSSRADSAQKLLALCYLKLDRMHTLDGQTEQAEGFRRKAAEAYDRLIQNYPGSKWADDASVFLIEAAISTAPSDSVRWHLILNSYQQFLKTYRESDRLDFVLLRIGDAYRGLSPEDSSAAGRAISIYQNLEGQFPHSSHADDARFRIGLCQLEIGDLAGAESSFRSMLSRYPDSELTGQSRFQLGQILFQKGDYQSVAEEFRLLLGQRLSADQPAQLIRLYLAEACSQMNEIDQAEVLYREILQQAEEGGRRPELVSEYSEKEIVKKAMLGLGLIYEEKDKYTEVVDLYSRFLLLYPQDSVSDTVLFHRGNALLAAERESEAVESFADLAQRYSSSIFAAQAAEKMGVILLHQENYNDALSAYNLALRLDKECMGAAGGVAVCLLRTGQEKRAADVIRSFTKEFGHSKEAEEWLGRFQYEQGLLLLEQKKYDKAREKFKLVEKRSPDSEFNEPSAYHAAISLLREGKKDEALQAFVDFRERFPSSIYVVQVNMRLGGLYYSERQFARAADAYRKVLEDANTALAPDAMFNTILAYEKLGQLGLAIEMAERLVSRFPDYESTPRVKVKIGIFLLELERYEKAAAQFNQCLQWSTGEQEAEVRYYIAECHFNLGEYQKALYWYLKVVYLNPEQQLWSVTAHYKAGQACERLDRFDEARNLYQQIIARYGASSEWGTAAKESLQKLQSVQQE